MSTWTKVRDSIEGFFSGKVWNFFKPFVTMIEANGSDILITAAEDAVMIGFNAPSGGTAAMTLALNAFKAEVIAKGLPFVESEARALIEVALQKAKAAAPTVVNSATAAISSVKSIGE